MLRHLVKFFEDKGIVKDLKMLSTKLVKLSIPELDNKDLIRAKRYLVGLGANNLAREICGQDIIGGNTFSQIIGISRQYVPLIKKFDITMKEVEMIKKSKKFIKEENFYKYRNMTASLAGYNRVECINNILKLMDFCSFQKIMNYYQRQINLCTDKDISDIQQYHKDYIDMLKNLEMDLKIKNIFMPRNIVEAHDRLSKKINEMLKLSVENENNSEIIYSNEKDFFDSNYIIVYPKTIQDLIKEGEVLGHCVGFKSYFNRIVKGKTIILFIRKIENESEPFVTVEIAPENLRLVQIYGNKNKRPTNEVVDFANKYIKLIKKDISDKYFGEEKIAVC